MNTPRTGASPAEKANPIEGYRRRRWQRVFFRILPSLSFALGFIIMTIYWNYFA